MKIGIVSTPIFPLPWGNYSGLEHIAWLTARGLAARGHQVVLFAPDGSECPGVTIVPFGPAGMVDEARAWGGFPEVKNGDVVVRPAHAGYWQYLDQLDVICDHSWAKHSMLLKMEGKLKAPVLMWMHAPVNTMISSLPPVDRPCVVCISQDQADHFKALFSRDARVCYNGVDVHGFYHPMEGVKRTDRFLFLARFSRIKGARLAIDACRQAGVGLDLVGDTSITNEPEYLRECKDLCDGKQIRMVGPATRSETVWWFSQAHCMVHLCPEFREPYGLAPVESMACGSPVISWDMGAMRETVKQGETGWLVRSMGEAIDAIKYAARGIDGKMRTRCQEWARDNFSVERMILRCEELCTEAIEKGW